MERMPRNWSELQEGPLMEISKRLDNGVDYVRFRSVCSSWRKAAPWRPQLPWLLAAYEEEGDNSMRLYEFPDLKPIQHRLQEGRLAGIIRGGCRGWVVLRQNDSGNLSLDNPFTGSHVSLPHIPESYRISHVVLSTDPVTAPNDCIVMAMFRSFLDHDHLLFFCRLGDDTWTRYPSLSSIVDDIIFYKGRFYALDGKRIFCCDIAPGAEAVEITAPRRRGIRRYDSSYSYLAGLSGDMLLVRILGMGNGFEERACWVYRVDLRSVPVKLVKLSDLGGQELFLTYMHWPICARGYSQNYIYDVPTDNTVNVLGVKDGNISLIKKLVGDTSKNWGEIRWIIPNLGYGDGGARTSARNDDHRPDAILRELAAAALKFAAGSS